MTLGQNLQRARKRKDLTQTQVGDMLGVKAATISGYESDYRSPDTETLAKLARIYEVSVDALLDMPLGIGETFRPGDPFPAPIVGTVHCGFGQIVLEDLEGSKMVDMQFLNNSKKEDYFWMRLKGNSMTGDCLENGDLVLVCRQPDVESGTIAVATVDDAEGTVKRVIKKPNMIILQPSNPAYEPMVFVGEELNRVRIVGEVVEARKDFKRQKKLYLVHEAPEKYE